jgi:hypothetical protein
MKKPRYKYPSVTEILEPWVDFSMVKPEVLRAAQIRGNVVHDVCAGYAKFGFTAKAVPQRYRGYFDSFRRWFDEEVEEVLAAEERIFCDALRVCGQLDLLIRLRHYPDNLPIIVDIKTPTVSQKTWEAQVAAYKFLAENHTGMLLLTGIPCSLRVREDGSDAILRPVCNHAEALKYWLKALECFHYFSN